MVFQRCNFPLELRLLQLNSLFLLGLLILLVLNDEHSVLELLHRELLALIQVHGKVIIRLQFLEVLATSLRVLGSSFLRQFYLLISQLLIQRVYLDFVPFNLTLHADDVLLFDAQFCLQLVHLFALFLQLLQAFILRPSELLVKLFDLLRQEIDVVNL